MCKYNLSVIIPTYNRYDFLVGALLSVKYDQDDYEVIVINDGAEYEEEKNNYLKSLHKNIRIINTCGKSVSKARNTGILASQGKWLVFLDDDDTFHPQYLYKLCDEIELRKSIDFFWCSVEIKQIDKHTSNEVINYKNYSSSYPTKVELYKNVLSIGASYGLAIRRTVLEYTGLFDPDFNVGEDTEFVMRMLDHDCIPGAIDFVGVTKIELHSDRLSHDFSIYSHNNIYERIFEKNINFLMRNPIIYRLLLEWAAKVHLYSGATKKAGMCIYRILMLGYLKSFLSAVKNSIFFVAKRNFRSVTKKRICTVNAGGH